MAVHKERLLGSDKSSVLNEDVDLKDLFFGYSAEISDAGGELLNNSI